VAGDLTIRKSAFAAIAVGVFLAQLDGTVMNVALPALSRAFHQTHLSAVQPVITVYLTAGVMLLPLLGRISDSLGRKRLFVAGFAIFGLASALCAMVDSLPLLVSLRFAQAIGGALLSGTGLALVAAYSGNTRGRSLGRLAIVFALSGLLGPPVGGGLVALFGWPSVFWLNVPVSLLGMAVAIRALPPDRRAVAPPRPDLGGAALFAAATALLSFGVVQPAGASLPGLGLGRPIAIALSLLGYFALVVWERRVEVAGDEPLLSIGLLRSGAYGIGLLIAFFSNGVTIALFVLVPFWLAHGWQVGNGALGLVFLPVGLGLGALSPVAGTKSDVLGPRLLTTAGMVVGALCALMLAWQATWLVWPAVMLGMLCLGISSGLFSAPNTNAILSGVPESSLAVAGSMLSAARTLGVIVGVSMGGAGYDALRADQGPNVAARLVFVAAAACYVGIAVLCWAVRPAPANVRALTRHSGPAQVTGSPADMGGA